MTARPTPLSASTGNSKQPLRNYSGQRANYGGGSRGAFRGRCFWRASAPRVGTLASPWPGGAKRRGMTSAREGEAQERAGGRPGATQASPLLVHTAPAPTRRQSVHRLRKRPHHTLTLESTPVGIQCVRNWSRATPSRPSARHQDRHPRASRSNRSRGRRAPHPRDRSVYR